MDNSYCNKHNEPIIVFDEKISDPQQRGLCEICAQQRLNDSFINQYNDIEKQKAFDFAKSFPKKTIQILQKMIDSIKQYQISVQTLLDEFIISLLQQIQFSQELDMELSLSLSYEHCQQKINERKQEIIVLINKHNGKLAKLNDSFQETNQLMQQNFGDKYPPFEYKLQTLGNKKQNEYCWAIAFDKNESKIFLGCNYLIKVHEFKNGLILKELQVLNAHTNHVTCLNYMKTLNQLISASFDSSLIIWNKNQQGQWEVKQSLHGHHKQINCLVQNQKENLLISGSDDQMIIFWEIIEQDWKQKQSIRTNFNLRGLSLDDQSNKLIACGCMVPQILVIQRAQNQEWSIIQIVQTQNYGLRLAFIDAGMFAFQPDNYEFLEIYECKQNLEFSIVGSIQVKTRQWGNYLFPCQFIKAKEILIVKNNAYLNILRRQANGLFVNEQSIDFQTYEQIGCASEDGEYLVTWDDLSNEIQVRKFQYLKQ